MRKLTSTILAFLFLVLIASCNNEVKKENKKEVTNELKNPSLSDLTITEETIKKDVDGKVISNEKFNEYLASGTYLATPVVKDGKIIEAQLQKASKEQVEALMKMFKESNKDIGKKAPDFTIKDLNGNEYNLSTLKDKIVVLNFWFTKCKPCVIEIPELNKLVEENEDVVFIGLSTDKEDLTKNFLEKHSFKYNIVADSKDIAKLYGVSSYPTHFIIKNGIIQGKFVGLSSDIKEKIQNSIDGKKEDKKVN